MMSEDELDQIWTVAYAMAFAITTFNEGSMGDAPVEPDLIDQRARSLADRATTTIRERADRSKKRRSR
jgi:hypothetical protein